MKHIMISMGILSLAFTVTFLYLIYEKEEPFREDAKKYICIATEGMYYWNAIHEGIQAADEEMGSYTKWVEFERFDIDEQIRKLKQTQYLDLDGVITVGEPYSDELNQTIQDIVERGIPVALIDTDSKESNRNYYIGTDNHQAGYLAAQEIAKATDYDADVMMIVSKLTHANQNERYEGFVDGLAEYEEMNLVSVIEAEGDKLTMQEQLMEAFLEFPSVEAIFCAESSSTRRLGPFLQQLKKEDLTIIGFDNADTTLEFIKDDFYLGTIAQSSYDIGYEAVACLNRYQEGSKSQEVYTDVTCITKENVDNFLPLRKQSK